MKKLVAVIFGALIVQTPFFSQEQAGDSSVQFEFKYKKNDRYRILLTAGTFACRVFEVAEGEDGAGADA